MVGVLVMTSVILKMGETRGAMDHLRHLNNDRGSVTLHVGDVLKGDEPIEVSYNEVLVQAGFENPYAAVAVGNNADGKCFFESLEQSLATGVDAYTLREQMLTAAEDRFDAADLRARCSST